MADDTVAYLDGVVGGPAHLVGWSDGAVVALLVASAAELVDRLVLIGQYYNSSGKVTGGLVDQLGGGGDQAMGFLQAEYDLVSPDGPEHFPVVYAKTLAMLATEPELELASLAAVAAPTLVLQGDRDEVTLEHGAAVATALPNGRLAVLPGTHALPLENPDVVNALLLWFLAGAARPSTGPASDPVANPSADASPLGKVHDGREGSPGGGFGGGLEAVGELVERVGHVRDRPGDEAGQRPAQQFGH